MAAEQPFLWLPVPSACEALLAFEGRLSKLCMHMPIFGNSPERLRAVSGIRHATEVQLCLLYIETETRLVWDPWHFRQLQELQVLQLDTEATTPFHPLWDFAACRSLQELHLSIDCDGKYMPCLDDIRHVFSTVFRIRFCHMWRQARCSLNCLSWTVLEAHVQINTQEKGCMPACVSDAVGSLMLSRHGSPVIEVIKMSLAEAATAAALSRLCHSASMSSVSSDFEVHYDGDWESDSDLDLDSDA